MSREGLEKLIQLMSADDECREHSKSIGSDMEALVAYAKELDCDVSPEELHECREKSLKLLKGRMKQSQRSEASLSPGVREFYALVDLSETDKEVEKRLAEISAGTREELIAYGREKGFNFDEQDIQAVSKDILEPTDELSEEELELVAGGTTAFGAFLVLGLVLGGAAVLVGGFIVGGIVSRA